MKSIYNYMYESLINKDTQLRDISNISIGFEEFRKLLKKEELFNDTWNWNSDRYGYYNNLGSHRVYETSESLSFIVSREECWNFDCQVPSHKYQVLHISEENDSPKGTDYISISFGQINYKGYFGSGWIFLNSDSKKYNYAKGSEKTCFKIGNLEFIETFISFVKNDLMHFSSTDIDKAKAIDKFNQFNELCIKNRYFTET